MDNIQLETAFLLHAVERKFDRRLSTTADFTALSEDMEENVSPSTLKRMWGYVGMKVSPRTSTLDVLSRYVGFKDYRAFCSDLRSGSFRSSGFFNAESIDARSLQKGDRFQIGWRPDRIVGLEYLGEGRFVVVSSLNSKLMEGDEFRANTVMKGFPLVLPEIIRGGETLPSYIAGRDSGIIFIRKA